MTGSIGGKKKAKRKNYQYLRTSGANPKRREFMDYDYLDKLDKESKEFLGKFTKEYYHASFETDEESRAMFKHINSLLEDKENKKFFADNGFHPIDVENAIEKFKKKTRKLGNLHTDIFDQKEINSDDYKRIHDIHNIASREMRLDELDKSPYCEWDAEDFEQTIEDLITESED